MNKEETTGLPDDLAALLPAGAPRALASGLAVLWRAYNYARDVEADRWDFAVEVVDLYDLRLTRSDLRWLVAKGLAEHGEETTVLGEPHRSFQPNRGLLFWTNSAMVLTDAGVDLGSRACAALADSQAPGETDTSQRSWELDRGPDRGRDDGHPLSR